MRVAGAATAPQHVEAAMYSRYLQVVNDERIASAYVVTQLTASQDVTEERAAKHAPGSRPTIYGRERREQLEGIIAAERLFREARAELARLNQGSSVPVPWYQAFGGPRTLGALSKRLKDDAFAPYFDNAYDLLSAAGHCDDAIGSISADFLGDDDASIYIPLRSTRKDDAVHLVSACQDLFTRTIVHQLEYFHEVPGGLREYMALTEQLSVALTSAEGPARD